MRASDAGYGRTRRCVASRHKSTTEYNCNTLKDVLDTVKINTALSTELATAPITRDADGKETSVETYISTIVLELLAQDDKASITNDAIFGTAQTACNAIAFTTPSNFDTFNVVVNGNVNLRSCAGTNCDIVDKAADGELLTVIGTDGDWYQVKRADGSTAFISASLTTRGPDHVVRTDNSYTDPRTGCYIAFNIKRGTTEVQLILAGKKQSDVLVDLYRPKEARPLRVEAQFDKTFIDTNEPYILQYYSYGVSWPKGMYQLEIKLGEATSTIAWELTDPGAYDVYVVCD